MFAKPSVSELNALNTTMIHEFIDAIDKAGRELVRYEPRRRTQVNRR